MFHSIRYTLTVHLKNRWGWLQVLVDLEKIVTPGVGIYVEGSSCYIGVFWDLGVCFLKLPMNLNWEREGERESC